MIGLENLFIDHGGRPATRRRRAVRAVVALALAGIPLGAVVWLAHRAAAVRRWPVVPCAIVDSGVNIDAGPDQDHPYQPWVSFAFTWSGRPCVGNRLSADGAGDGGRTDDAAEAYARAARYTPGTPAQCYVDVADPPRSVLAQPVAAWEPLAVPVAAVTLVVVVVFYCVPQLRRVPRVRVHRPWMAAVWGGLLFVGFGSATVGWWGRPVVRSLAAGRWSAVPCVVESARVQSHQEHGGEVPLTFYRTDVLYRYAVGGRTYHANCYCLTETQSPARGGRARIVAGYPVGGANVCYVDPADPWSATLTRHLSPTLIFAAVPLLFTVAGAVLVLDAGRGWLGRPLGRLLHRSRWTLATVGVAVLCWTAWAIFARP